MLRIPIHVCCAAQNFNKKIIAPHKDAAALFKATASAPIVKPASAGSMLLTRA
jgi:hypothetical protein